MKNLLLILLVMMGYITSGLACSMSIIQTGYEQQENNIVYVSDQIDSKKPKVIAVLEEVDASKFHPLGELKQDFFHWDNTGYFSDDKHIIWQGKILVNDKDLPAVDVKTFQQSSANLSFAVDKQSIYFDGKRTDDNTGIKKVALTTLKVLDAYMMSDTNNLYYQGQYRGKAEGYQVVSKAQYGSPGVSCFVGDYIIAKSKQYVFINGEIIVGADPQTFSIKRWMPEILLDYTDKTGAHTYAYGKTELELEQMLEEQYKYLSKGVYVLRDKVVYVKRSAPYGEPVDPKYIVEIKGLEPQKVHFINNRTLTQDGKTIYIFEGYFEANTRNKELTMRVIHLDEPNSDLSDENIINDKNYIYFINDNKKFRAFKRAGQFIKLGDYFARDDKYIYILGTAKRFKTAKPEAVRLNTYYYLVTAEGVYDTDGRLHAQ